MKRLDGRFARSVIGGIAAVAAIAAGCSQPGDGAVGGQTSSMGPSSPSATPSSATPSATSSYVTEILTPPDLSVEELIAANPGVLGRNVSDPSLPPPTACSKDVGVAKSVDRPMVFFTCTQGGDAASPARVLPVGTTIAEVVAAVFSGPTKKEAAAGFSPAYGVPVQLDDVRAEVVDGVAVVDLVTRDRAVVGFLSQGYTGRTQLLPTIRSAAGVKRVSVLINGHPACKIWQAC